MFNFFFGQCRSKRPTMHPIGTEPANTPILLPEIKLIPEAKHLTSNSDDKKVDSKKALLPHHLYASSLPKLTAEQDSVHEYLPSAIWNLILGYYATDHNDFITMLQLSKKMIRDFFDDNEMVYLLEKLGRISLELNEGLSYSQNINLACKIHEQRADRKYLGAVTFSIIAGLGVMGYGIKYLVDARSARKTATTCFLESLDPTCYHKQGDYGAAKLVAWCGDYAVQHLGKGKKNSPCDDLSRISKCDETICNAICNYLINEAAMKDFGGGWLIAGGIVSAILLTSISCCYFSPKSTESTHQKIKKQAIEKILNQTMLKKMCLFLGIEEKDLLEMPIETLLSALTDKCNSLMATKKITEKAIAQRPSNTLFPCIKEQQDTPNKKSDVSISIKLA